MTGCVLGIGSPFGDDQAGWWVVDRLRDAGVGEGDGIVVQKLDRPGGQLVEGLSGFDWAILVDAAQTGTRRGEIRRFGTNDWGRYAGGLSSHGFGVVEALALARELGALPVDITLFGIEIGDASPGTASSAEVLDAANRLADEIRDALRARGTTGPRAAA